MTIFVPELNALVETEREPNDSPLDETLCARIGRKLMEHYPDWDWKVEIPPGQNVVIVRNLTCDPYGKVGMVKHKDKLDPTLRGIIMAAGELLERFHMKRGRFDPSQTEGRLMHCARADDDPRNKKR